MIAPHTNKTAARARAGRPSASGVQKAEPEKTAAPAGPGRR
jgi:hypothetical protein